MTPSEQILARLDELTQIAEKATPGPWAARHDMTFPHREFFAVEHKTGAVAHCGDCPEDCEFIAASRNTWPALIEVARVAVEALKKFGHDQKPACPCRECNAARAITRILAILERTSK